MGFSPLVIFLLVLGSPLSVFARVVELPNCEEVLLSSSSSTREPMVSEVDKLIRLALEYSLSDLDVHRLLTHIAINGFMGLGEISLGSDAQHLRDVFLQLGTNGEQLWIEEHIQSTLSEELKVERVDTLKREERIRATRSLSAQMEFVTVPGGKFFMGGLPPALRGFSNFILRFIKKKVTLTQGMHVMTTKVTQGMWEEVMKYNPSHFKRRLNHPINHPIENITWWSAVVFANRVSRQHGLRPVWDLSQIEFQGSAEQGTLQPVAFAADAQILIDSGDGNYLPEKESNIYKSEGFRLGTEAEKEYLFRNLGRANGDWPFDIKEEDVSKYAWIADNSGNTTHPVGTTEGLFTFYGTQIPVHDLFGNVSEWGDDYYQNRLSSGVDPRGRVAGVVAGDRVLRVGSWSNWISSLREDDGEGRIAPSPYRRSDSPRMRMSNRGLRLLRTARQ